MNHFRFKLIDSQSPLGDFLAIGGLRGIKTASIPKTVVTYKDDISSQINNYVDGENAMIEGGKNEILIALEAIVKLDKK